MNFDKIYSFFNTPAGGTETTNLKPEDRLAIFLGCVAVVVLFLFSFLNYKINNSLWAEVDFSLAALLAFTLLGKKQNYISLASLNIILVASLELMLTFKHSTAPEGLFSNILWMPLINIVAFILLTRGQAVFAAGMGIMLMIFSNYLYSIQYYSFVSLSANEISLFNNTTILLSFTILPFILNKVLQENRKMKVDLEHRLEDLFVEKEEKSALVSLLSHDLSNSLMVIKGNAEIAIHSKRLDSLQKDKKIRTIHKHTLVVEEVLKQVKEFQGITSGKIKVKLRPVDIIASVNQALEVLESRLNDKEINVFFLNDNSSDPLYIEADETSLVNNVLLNILTNAIKFSHKGSKIEVSILKSQDRVILRVEDFGVGIPPKNLPHLFSKKVSVTERGTQGEKGTGFGMPIMKMFLDKYGAQVKVLSIHESESYNRSGTVFEITFKKSYPNTSKKMAS